jgi:hypothetical protein
MRPPATHNIQVATSMPPPNISNTQVASQPPMETSEMQKCTWKHLAKALYKN